MTLADDDVLLDIDVVELTREGLRQLERCANDPRTAWYYTRRREALAAAGLVGAYNPLQPRGRDGKWIEMFGWVRWLDDGKWKRARVTNIDKDGTVQVTDSAKQTQSFNRFQARQKLYTAAKTKAVLSLPNPKADTPADGFTKVGGQGGSNPGGLYKVTDQSSVKGSLALTPDMVREAIKTSAPGTLPEKLNMLEFDTPATVMGRFKPNAFVIDEKRNKAYIRMTDDLLWDLDTDQPADVSDVFGAPESKRRAEVMDSLTLYSLADAATSTDVLATAQSMGVNKPTNDTQFYVKTAKSNDHAKVEVLANDLYELAGVAVPNVSMGQDGIGVASEIVTGDTVQPLSAVLNDPGIMTRVRQDFVIDAWLANWDVAGAALDNMLIVDGQPYRIDAGGALTYRAMGGAKGNKFGNEVNELDTLRNPGLNPQSAKVFGGVTASEQIGGAERLAAISPQQIINMVESADLDKSLADKLIARRKYILDKYGVKDPHAGDVADPIVVDEPDEPAATPPLDLKTALYDVTTKSLVPGQPLNKNAAMEYANFIGVNASPLVASEVAEMYAAGDSPLIEYDDGLWQVTGVSPLGISGYYFDLRHVGTGDTTRTHRNTSQSVYGTADPNGTIAEAANDLWEAHQLNAVNAIKNPADLLGGGGGAGLVNTYGTISAATVPVESLLGKWLMFDGTTSGTAYHVDKVLANGAVELTTLKGQTYVKKPGHQWRTGRPGSLFNQTLDAIKARNDAAAGIDAKDTDTPTSKVTPSDLKLAQLNSSTASPVIPSGTPTIPPEPNALAAPGDKVIHFDPDTGVNKKLHVLGEPVLLTDLTSADEQEWVGKQVYLRKTVPDKSFGTSPKSPDVGLFTVTSIGNNGMVGVVDATGLKMNYSPYNMEMFQVEADIAPIMNLQFKKDNTVAINGVKIGTWSKHNDWTYSYEPYSVVIDPEFSASGGAFRTSVGQKAAMRQAIVPMLLPPGSGGARPKSTKAVDLEAAVRANVQFGSGSAEVTDAGTAATLLDGAKVEVGMWVISKTDGKVGQVSLIEQGTGYVKVKMEDGSVKGRAASTLSAAGDPTTGAIPTYSPLYASVKLSDGSQPFPSQDVTVGGGSATIVMIKPDGNVRIVDDKGKFTWTNASKLTPAKQYAPAAKVDMDSSPAIVAKLGDNSWKTAPKPSKIPYGAGPAGTTTIPQASNAVELYRQYAHHRKLTRDGFVPHIGMIVRDDKGNQLVITRIANSYDGNPSTVWTIPVSNKYANPTGRQPSRLWVDHVAELSTSDGKPLPKISALHTSANDKGTALPTGGVIYEYTENAYVLGRMLPMKKHLIAMPDGTAHKLTAYGLGNKIEHGELYNLFSGKYFDKPQKIAYVDELSDTMMSYDSIEANNYGGHNHVVTDVWIHSTEEGALEALKKEVHQKKLDAGIVEPEKFEGTQAHLITLPKPSTAPSSGDAVVTPPPPVARADPDKLRGAAVVGGSFTIESGIERLREQIAAGGPGANTLYAMGDSDYIEDMAIRVQSAVDTHGNDYVEVRFRLLEDKIDYLAEHVISSDSSKIGGWRRTKEVGVEDLVDGDAISVRISGSGALKPGTDNRPNATIVGTPKKVGVSDKGFDAYEVQVALASGVVGKLILEKRATASVNLYEWDPLMVLPATSFKGSVSADATQAGWSLFKENAVGYEALAGSKSMIDSKGRKIFDLANPEMTSTVAHNGAMRLQYDAGEGGTMLVQMTHPASEKRLDIINHNGDNASRRASVNGEVTIRVRADDPNALEKISKMMSAAGVPPEAQGQPTGVQLRKMALNKVYKQLNDTYSHMKRPDVTGEDDASAQAVISLIDKRFGAALGRPATMSDIMFRTTPEGRVTVVFSDDVARAIAKNSNFKYAFHSFSYGGGSFTPSVLSSPVGTGLMSTDERWSQGITVGGASSKQDVANDAGNRVYFRVGKDLKSLTGDNLLFVSPAALAKNVDVYFNPGDRYGKRAYKNGTQYGPSASYQGNNEILVKRKIDPEMFGYVIVGSESAQKKRIADLKAQGVTHIGGRPLEEVIVVSGTRTADQLGELGMNWGTEVPITTIPGAPVP